MSKPGLAEKKMMAWFGGDMREEKVSRSWRTDMLGNDAPAADAVPRQSDWQKLAIHWHNQSCACRDAKGHILAEGEFAPTVPQEAPESDVEHQHSPDDPHIEGQPCACDPEPAPDWALRASQDLFDRGYWSAKSTEPAPTQKAQVPHVAALVREAGSERERELTHALNNALYVMNSRPQQGWDKWRNAVAEASRLLGLMALSRLTKLTSAERRGTCTRANAAVSAIPLVCKAVTARP